MAKERGTFLVELTDGSKYIFGNNYKPWWQHAVEYIYRYEGDRELTIEKGWRYAHVADVVKSVYYSNQPFYDDGGLKWCNLNSYQEVVTEVCNRDKLVPVVVDEIVFEKAPHHMATLTKKLKEY